MVTDPESRGVASGGLTSDIVTSSVAAVMVPLMASWIAVVVSWLCASCVECEFSSEESMVLVVVIEQLKWSCIGFVVIGFIFGEIGFKLNIYLQLHP